MSENSTVCIIGMHRSGTSMVTHILNVCGLYLGPEDNILGGHESNPNGHFENLDFLELNIKLLENFSASWDCPPKLKDGWELDPLLEPIESMAKELISKFSDKKIWGWKEPRTTIFLPFWRGLLPDLKVVVCVRNPIEVAMSLSKRNGMDLEMGVSLWHVYMQAAEKNTEECQRLFVFYDDFFVDPEYEMDRLVKFCGLKIKDGAKEIVSADYRHFVNEENIKNVCQKRILKEAIQHYNKMKTYKELSVSF